MSEPIFEITKQHLETGLRGYPVGYCPTSRVDPEKGLFYLDQPISELAHQEPMDVIYMLYHGEKGNSNQVETFFKDLTQRAHLSAEVTTAIRSLPREGHPMKLFSAAMLTCGMLEGTGDYKEDCLNVIAKLPLIVATVINYHAGWGEATPHPEAGYMENFVQMLNVPGGNKEELLRTLKLFNILHYDHGGGNLSAFVGKAVCSGLEDLYGSLSASLCALAGPRHGKANQDCLEFIKEVIDKVGQDATEDQLADYIKTRLDNKELIYGFGHAVLRVEDPRATVQYAMAEQYYADHPYVKMALMLRNVASSILKENPKVSNPYPNVDAISGSLLTASGFSYPEYYTVLFGLSRLVGISIQIVYERLKARDGKGVPIYRPKYFYQGPK